MAKRVNKKKHKATKIVVRNPFTKVPYFKCEICGMLTPIEFEGGQPNTCADCYPLDWGKDWTDNTIYPD